MTSLADVSWADLLAPTLLVLAWLGYAAWAERGQRRSLMVRMHEYRLAWMQRMARRENRIVDMQVVIILVQNISFLASASIFIIGGLVAIMGAREQAMQVMAMLPLAASSSAALWEAKVLLMIVIFVYAFFKFTWSLRQFNYVAIMIGAVAPPREADEPQAQDLIVRTAMTATRAADHFNRAMRANYFGLAGLAWFIHPWLLIVSTVLVVAVIWRREFHSHSLRLLGPVGSPLG